MILFSALGDPGAGGHTAIWAVLLEVPVILPSREIKEAVECAYLELWGNTDLRESSIWVKFKNHQLDEITSHKGESQGEWPASRREGELRHCTRVSSEQEKTRWLQCPQAQEEGSRRGEWSNMRLGCWDGEWGQKTEQWFWQSRAALTPKELLVAVYWI